ncbi:hypothetical protein [Paenibacillus apiarius]|uniref:DUF5626 domain-containing protein n=1 Tax=Paenibacillus apiarius TaxID=46240 RepID=A0ABT4DZA1_9BACL|nr:hypothetical protein [Paenibacillus apiarius]MCY9517850.1 hypothetical protein [Paenibacillus apiarius]MCY9522685.1 hypothetical protein [Paenibacillus apiarius]MCY9555370.1 hypothetical protein [Paenibacillus apiarius]MCY9561250.1 hypothetical protein [Paenibacillus apiarius]MCY9686557.1 hypothetical protein [Paenibacillus apiarius]
MKKAVVIISTVLLLSSFTCIASAAPDSSRIAIVQTANQATEASKIITYETDSGDISILDDQVIPPVHHTGKGAYTGEFTTSRKNGKYLNVFCKNNGSGTVYLTIYRNEQSFVEDIPIASGDHRTQKFEEKVATGISGDWKVYIYTKDGAKMDINVSARQY